jgi:glycosyltransferase involved in cell wall biosynthesis
MKVIYLTNIPVHYKDKIHEKLSKKLNKNYIVIYCNKIEPNRKWKNKLNKYKKIFLDSKPINFRGNFTYINFSILQKLNSLNPDVLIINGNSFPMILSFFWAKILKKKVISTSDTSINSEKKKKLNLFQILIRKLIYSKFDAYICTSKKNILLYKKYGANKNFFFSPLAVDKIKIPNINRNYDVILCGRFIKSKLFNFAIEVLNKVNKIMKIKVKIVGYGPLKNEIINLIKSKNISYVLKESVPPNKIIKEFSTSKIFLFPTAYDAWGVVANEACLAKTPVITCINAGCANELIINNFNGYVLKLNINLWSKKIISLLKNKKKLKKFSVNSFKIVSKFNSDYSSDQIMKAIKSSFN